jgi:hypothetical protein
MNFKKILIFLIIGLLVINSVFANKITGAPIVDPSPDPIPEFNATTLIIGLAVIIAGYFTIKYLKKQKK